MTRRRFLLDLTAAAAGVAAAALWASRRGPQGGPVGPPEPPPPGLVAPPQVMPKGEVAPPEAVASPGGTCSSPAIPAVEGDVAH